MKNHLSIGEVSKLTGLPISKLRYYDSQEIVASFYKNNDKI